MSHNRIYISHIAYIKIILDESLGSVLFSVPVSYQVGRDRAL
jgi:hypothetical protein